MLVMLFFSGIVEFWIELWTKNFETKLCSWNLSECLWKLNVKTLPLACSYATQPENLLKVIVSLGKPNLWWNFGSCALVSVDKILVFFYFNTKESLFCEHTKTKKEVEQAGTTCNTQKRAQTTWNELRQDGTSKKWYLKE